MKLSIVIFNKNDEQKCNKLIDSIFKEKGVQLEVVIFDSSRDSSLNTLYKNFRKEINESKLKIISSINLRPTDLRKQSLKHVTGDYVLFIYSVDQFNKGFLEKIVSVGEVFNTDIIEFGVKHIGPVKINYDYLKEMENNKVYKIQERPIIYSLISPFLYTKAFRTSFLRENISILEISSRYDVFYTYLLVASAKTYYFIEDVGIKIFPTFYNRKIDSLVFNQWTYILNFLKNYKNWNEIESYVEYSFVKWMFTVSTKIIKYLVNDPVSRHQYLIDLKKKVNDIFPDFVANPMIRQDKKLLKSKPMKSYKKKYSIFMKTQNKLHHENKGIEKIDEQK